MQTFNNQNQLNNSHVNTHVETVKMPLLGKPQESVVTFAINGSIKNALE
jgi:hypothetical protein